jgi:hypothetical protein
VLPELAQITSALQGLISAAKQEADFKVTTVKYAGGNKKERKSKNDSSNAED